MLSAMGQYLTLVYLLSLNNTCQRKHNRAKYKKRWQNNSVMSENFSIASDCTMCNAHVLFRTGPGDQDHFFRVKVVFGQNWTCRPAQLCSGTYATFWEVNFVVAAFVQNLLCNSFSEHPTFDLCLVFC